MKFPLYIALRYLVSKNGKNAINIINILSFAITMIGAASLFIVLAGFSGLREFSLQFSEYFDADIQVTPLTSKTIEFTPLRKQKLEKLSGIEAYSTVIQERAFLDYDGKNAIAYLRGVDNTYPHVVRTDSVMLIGVWPQSLEGQSIVGAGLAGKLSIGIYSYDKFLEVMTPKPGTGAITDIDQALSRKNLIVSGIFSVNESVDDKYVFTSVATVRELLNLLPDQYTSIELRVTGNEDELRKNLNNIFEGEVMIKNRLQQNEELYKMLNAENLVVYLIFTLVLIIALFNVVGSIILAALDKRENLITMYHMGAQISSIRKIFLLQGVLMTVVGGVFGTLAGALLVYLQQVYGFIMITPSLAYPIVFEWYNLLATALTIMALGTLASFLASRRITYDLLTQEA